MNQPKPLTIATAELVMMEGRHVALFSNPDDTGRIVELFIEPDRFAVSAEGIVHMTQPRGTEARCVVRWTILERPALWRDSTHDLIDLFAS